MAWEYEDCDDFETMVKLTIFCRDWQSLCWLILRAHDLVSYCAANWALFCSIVTFFGILSYAGYLYLRPRWEQQLEPLRNRISNLNRDFVNLQLKLLRLSVAQRMAGLDKTTKFEERKAVVKAETEKTLMNNTEKRSSKEEMPKNKGEAYKLRYKPFPEIIDDSKSHSKGSVVFDNFLKCHAEERGAFLEIRSTSKANEQGAQIEPLQFSTKQAAPTEVTPKPTRCAPKQAAPKRAAPVAVPPPSISSQTRRRSQSQSQTKSQTERTPITRNRSLNRVNRVHVKPTENGNGQGRCDEQPSRNINNNPDGLYETSTYYVPPIVPFQRCNKCHNEISCQICDMAGDHKVVLQGSHNVPRNDENTPNCKNNNNININNNRFVNQNGSHQNAKPCQKSQNINKLPLRWNY